MTEDIHNYLDSILSGLEQRRKVAPGNTREEKIKNLYAEFEKLFRLHMSFKYHGKAVSEWEFDVKPLPHGDPAVDVFLNKKYPDVMEILEGAKEKFRGMLLN
jgi:hypothetical protein